MPPAPLLCPTTLRSLALTAAFAVGLVCGMVALTFVVQLHVVSWIAASVATAAMIRATFGLATRRPAEPTDAALLALGWGLFMGVLNVGVAYLAAVLVAPDAVPRSVLLTPLAMLVGAPAGAILGLLFGGLLTVPVVALMIARHRQTPAASDHAAAVIGVWVAVAPALAMAVPEAADTWVYSLWSPNGTGLIDPLQRVMMWGVSLVVALGGTALAVLALDRAAARRRFVQRVSAGLEPRWRIEVATADPGLAMHPCLGDVPDRCGHVLHRVEQPGDAAYRSAETSWPVARVPSAWIPRA